MLSTVVLRQFAEHHKLKWRHCKVYEETPLGLKVVQTNDRITYARANRTNYEVELKYPFRAHDELIIPKMK